MTNELVDWFNSVDASYQFHLRELNEINFARFDAKLEQRVAALDAKIDGLEAKLERRIGVLEAKVDQRFGTFEARVDQRFAEHREYFARFETRMIRWMVMFWTSTMVTLAGLFVAILRSK